MSDKRADDGPFWESSNFFFLEENMVDCPMPLRPFLRLCCFPLPFFFFFGKEDMIV